MSIQQAPIKGINCFQKCLKIDLLLVDHPPRYSRKGVALRERNLKDYENKIGVLVKWCTEHGKEYVEDLTRRDMEDFLNTFKPATRNRYLNTLRAYLDIIGVEVNPFTGICVADERRDRVAREILTDEQLTRLIRVSDKDLDCMRPLIHVLIFTGLRLGDAIRLKWSEVQGDFIRTKAIKTGAELTIPLHPVLRKELTRFKNYIRDMPKQKRLAIVGAGKNSYIFYRWFNEEGEPASKYISMRVCKLFVKARIGDGNGVKWGAHSLRHTCAYKHAEIGTPLNVIQSWLGHGSPAITKIYTDHATAKAKLEAMRNFNF